MEKDAFSGAILAWVKGWGAFLKVRAGTGDNLLDNDLREGFADYSLWFTFRPECVDIDGELDMECLDSGMVLFRECYTPGAALESSFRQVFRYPLCGASDAGPATSRSSHSHKRDFTQIWIIVIFFH